MHRGPPVSTAFFLAWATALSSAQASAHAGALEEIIVSASKRTESLQDVAIMVTAFSEQTTLKANITNADDLFPDDTVGQDGAAFHCLPTAMRS